jgi:hypothetical protein
MWNNPLVAQPTLETALMAGSILRLTDDHLRGCENIAQSLLVNEHRGAIRTRFLFLPAVRISIFLPQGSSAMNTLFAG